jgi:mannose-6-phosphate isomerase-like protein (cupin superfamily)
MSTAIWFVAAMKQHHLTDSELEWISNGVAAVNDVLEGADESVLVSYDACFSLLYITVKQMRISNQPAEFEMAASWLRFLAKPDENFEMVEALNPSANAFWNNLQMQRVQSLTVAINAKKSLTGLGEDPHYHARIDQQNQESLYDNQSEKLGIDFQVTRLPFNTELLDPRIVRVAPGKTNELHKHAHETVFVFYRGSGYVRIDEHRFPVNPGDVVFIPRWCMHQSVNESSEDMVFLAVADFGLTGKSFVGNYLKTARQKSE